MLNDDDEQGGGRKVKGYTPYYNIHICTVYNRIEKFKPTKYLHDLPRYFNRKERLRLRPSFSLLPFVNSKQYNQALLPSVESGKYQNFTKTQWKRLRRELIKLKLKKKN